MAEAWREWEHHVQEVLGLDSTPASGNQFNAPGDAVDNRHPSESGFPLLVDCKFTEKMSYPLNLINARLWLLRGIERGKRAILAIRILPPSFEHPGDFVVISLDDFAELLEKARENEPEHDWAVDRTYLERDEYQGKGA